MTAKEVSPRKEIFDILKTKFDKMAFWEHAEGELALLCSNLPDSITKEKRKEFEDGLNGIRDCLSNEGVSPKELLFIGEEIERANSTETISLYNEEEDNVEKSIINTCARLTPGAEGVMGIDLPLNYTQLSKVTNGVYEKTGLIKFYISNQKTVYGKIVAEIYEYLQKIPIATLIESKKKDPDTDKPLFKKIILFGQKYDVNLCKLVKEISLPFYVYRLISDDGNEYIIISTQKCEIGDYIIKGVVTQCTDYKMLTDSAKLPTKLPFLFVHSVQNRIIQFKNNDEFLTKIKELNICKENIFDYPFAIEKDKRMWKLLHPPWFKRLIWAWLIHEKKGLMNNYPLHLLVVGPKGSGKSLMLNGLHAKSKEIRSVFSGSSSTIKSLIPSFKYNPARLGYFAESNRFSFCDEFFRCFLVKKEGEKDEGVALMNDLLEHQKREAGSGVSRVNVNMTSRIIATTNPVREMKTCEDLIRNLDESFLSRWLIVFQTDEHVSMVRKSNDIDLQPYYFHLKINDWISILDYLHTFSANYDFKRIERIYDSIPEILSQDLKNHYDARHKHHIECFMDGIVKTRCLFEGDISFNATEEDYEMLKTIWTNIIRSWINPEAIRRAKISDRIYYLPEKCQYIYSKMKEFGKPIEKLELAKICASELNSSHIYEAIRILMENELVIEDEKNFKLYWMGGIKDGSTEGPIK